MTKKHYEAIARILYEYTDDNNIAYAQFVQLTNELADYFASDNPRFDHVRFLKACGIECEHANITDDGDCMACDYNVYDIRKN